MPKQDPIFTTEAKSNFAAAAAMLPGASVQFWAITSGHLLLSIIAAVASLVAGRCVRTWVESVCHDKAQAG